MVTFLDLGDDVVRRVYDHVIGDGYRQGWTEERKLIRLLSRRYIEVGSFVLIAALL